MPHLSGLDGLRGLAVIGVLLFHGGFTWARGGFLGVSTFFTLSGFLITNILVREWDATSAIGLGRFWTRRFRRLLPAALVAIALVGLVWWRVGSAEQISALRGDMLSSVAYVANWRFLFSGTSYASLFSAPSPLQHFWSLAIEEQFYLFFPLIVIVVMRLGGRRLLTGVLTAALAVSISLSVFFSSNTDRVYYGTDTRASELLLGCLLAVWWSGRSRVSTSEASKEPGKRGTVIPDAFGLVALAAMFWAWWAVEETWRNLARGGFPLYAIATTLIIFAATRDGLVAKLLSFRVLRWAGLISYGLYLYHWPIFLLIDNKRLDWPTLPLFAVRMTVTIAVAVVSYFLLEMPIRRGTMFRTGRAALSAGLAGAVVVASVAFAVTLSPPASQVPYAEAKVGSDFTSVATIDPVVLAELGGAANPARSILILGDSGTMDVQPALTAEFIASGTATVVRSAAPGFGITKPFGWEAEWTKLVNEYDPDLVIVMLGGWDIDAVKANGLDSYLAVGQEAVDILTANGAKILWLPMLPGGSGRQEIVDPMFALLAEQNPLFVANPSIAYSLEGPDGTYPRLLTTADGTRLLLRKNDNWHLCQDGAERVARAIMEQAVILGWSSDATPGWERGGWRSDPAYDDPKGVCDGG